MEKVKRNNALRYPMLAKVLASANTSIRLLKDFNERLYEDQIKVKENPNENHPLKDKLNEWQVYTDILHFADKKGDVVTIEDLAETHDQDVSYYQKNIPLLIKDGLIEWV